MVMKNNIREEKIKEQFQEVYGNIEPSIVLREKIKQAYQQNQNDNKTKNNNIIINLLHMTKSYKFALAIGSVAIVLLIGGTAVYFQGGKGGRSLSLKEADKILSTEEFDAETKEITNDLNENLDDLDLLAQSDNNADIIKQSNTDLDEIDMEDLTETLDGLDEIDDILNEDVFGDDLFL